MANEISIQFKLAATKGGVTVQNSGSSLGYKQQNMQSSLTRMIQVVQDVGTTSEDLLTGDVPLGSEQWVLLINRDPTNYVDVEAHKDASNFATIARMRPGEPFLCRLNAQSGGYPKLRLKANTASCPVEVIVISAGDPAL